MRVSNFAALQVLSTYIVLASQDILIDQADRQKPKQANDSLFSAVFNRVVEDVLENYHIAGLSVAIINGSNIQSKGYGFSILPAEAASPDTLWQAGSTTKAFTSAALSLLVDADILRWTSSVRSVLGDDFAVQDDWATNHLTIDDMVSHRTGLPRYDYVYHANISNTEMVQGLRHLPMTAEPRTTFQYCNLMFTTLGVVVEKLSGGDLSQFLTEKLWAPLGMSSTYLSRESASHSGNVIASGYHWNDQDARFVLASQNSIDRVGGAGAAVSTVIDYAKWVCMFLRRAPPLSSRGHTAVLKPRTIMDNAPTYVPPNSVYAAGWIVSTYYDHQIVWHTGGLPGFGSLVMFLPDLDLGIVIMGNSEAAQNYGSFEIAYTLIDGALGVAKSQRRDWLAEYQNSKQEKEKYLLTARQRLYPHVPSPPLPHSLPLDLYAGKYRHPSYGPLDIYVSSDRLMSVVGFGLSESRIIISHVSGEYWIAEMADEATDEIVDVFRVEFRIGIEGIAEWILVDLGINTTEVGKWVWFGKSDAES